MVREEKSPAADASPLIVARIGAPYGVRGWNHLRSFTDPVENILRYPKLLLRAPDGALRALDGIAVTAHRDGFVVQLPHSHNRDDAAALRGWELALAPRDLPPLDVGEYYWRDLIGLRVVNEDGETLGRVAHLLETGQHDVLVLKAPAEDGPERLIPFVAPYLQDVDLPGATIRVAWDAQW
ncbi:MAG: ribosome maturation factor RimM [Pseudomonadota bacterium]